MSNIEFEEKLKEIVQKTLVHGQLLIVGTKQTGKTNAGFWLVRKARELELHKSKTLKIQIFDLPMVWRFKFDSIPYVNVQNVRRLPETQDLIIDIPYTDVVRTRDVVLNVFKEDFVKKRRMKERLEGNVPIANLYVLEECQNYFGTYALAGKSGKFALKIFSEGSNYNMAFIGITQRLADVSTKIVERSQYLLIGKLTGDNDLRKIKRITNKQIMEHAKQLRRGEFIFWDRDNREYVDLIGFPKFKQNGKPFKHQNGKTNAYVKQFWLGE